MTDSKSNKKFDFKNAISLRFRSLPKRYYKAEKETEAHIWTLRGVGLGLFIIIMGCLYAIGQMPSQIPLYQTPNLETGSTRKIQDVPPYAVYSTALYLWQTINKADNLAVDYEKNLTQYGNYISPEFKKLLLKNFNAERGEKSNVSRRVSEKIGTTWTEDNRIVNLGNKKWVVFLDITITERLNGQVIRNSSFRYPLLVQQVDFDPATNPTGMQLSGFYGNIERL